MTKQTITPYLWFDTQALEAATFYSTVFPDSQVTHTSHLGETPNGDTHIVGFQIMGYEFMAISAGPMFQINPSISFHVKCRAVAEVEAIWAKLAPAGTVMIPLDEYPFSKRYGWVQDQYGVSWQIIFTEVGSVGADPDWPITPALMFTNAVCGRAEEAVEFYASVFPNSTAQILERYQQGEAPDEEGTVKFAHLTLDGQEFAAMDSAWPHDFSFSEGISLMVKCADQAEIDYLWEKLSAVKEAEQCGWLKDRFGVSWQIIPENLDEMMAVDPAKTTPALLAMKKIVISDLIAAGAQT